MKVLDLSMNGFEDDGARALCDALRGNNTLTELNIRNNRISTVGAAHIARGLEGNCTLEVLKVSTVYHSKTYFFVDKFQHLWISS